MTASLIINQLLEGVPAEELVDVKAYVAALPDKNKELVARTKGGANYLTENVAIDFNDLIHYNLEWLNDQASTQITGSEVALGDITYKPVGVVEDFIIITVTGSVETYLQNSEDFE